MAAAGSRVRSKARRGAHTGQGASVQREDAAPLPSLEVYVPAIESLEEISGWLGTFRERLRVARIEDQTQVAQVVKQLEARYQMRRAELS
jgi:hypothetical protein